MMFFKTVLLSMRRRKKEIRFLAIATFIVVLFMSSVSLFQNVMDRYVIETNYKNFGEWVFASVDIELSHPYFSMSGDCISGMPLFDEEGEGLSECLGTIDENFMKLANLSFYEGRLPEEDGEIATTLSMLAKMGLTYDLGQEIKLQVLDGEVLKEKTFTLVGIYRDFATGWQTNGQYPLPGCLVTKEVLLNAGGISYTTHFYQLDREYEGIDMAEFRRPFMSGEDTETIVYNSGAYEKRLWGTGEMFQNVQRILVVIAVLVICYLMLSYVTKRRKWYYQLRSTGASKLQIWLMIMIEGAYATVPWAILAIAVPYAVAIPISAKISEEMQVPSLFIMDWQNLMMQIVAVFGIILIALIVACISCRDKRLSQNIYEVTQGQIEELRRVTNNGKNVAKSFLKRQNIMSQGRNFVWLLLTIIVAGILTVCVLMIYKQYSWYQMFVARPDVAAGISEDSVYTYTQILADGEPSVMEQNWPYSDMYMGLDEEMEAQLEVMEGIESIEKTMRTSDHYLEWEGKEDSEIIQWYVERERAQDKVEEDIEKIVNLGSYFPIVFDTYDALHEMYGELFEEAGVKEEAFKKGEQIFVITTDETLEEYTDDTYTEFEIVNYTEKTLNAGDMVRVRANHSVCDYEIEAAVIHMTREEYGEKYNQIGYAFGDYQVFATFEFAEKLAEEAGESELKYSRINITFDGNATYNSTMKKLAALLEKYGFSYDSEWERKQTERDSFIQCCYAYGTMFVVVLSVYLIILMNLNQMKNYDRARKYLMLKRLGMSDSFFHKMILKQGVLESLWFIVGIPVGYFMFGWVLRAQDIQQGTNSIIMSTFLQEETTSFFWIIIEYIYTNWSDKCFWIIVMIMIFVATVSVEIVLKLAKKAVKEGKVS